MKLLDLYLMRNSITKFFNINFDIQTATIFSESVGIFFGLIKGIEEKENELRSKNVKDLNPEMMKFMDKEVDFKLVIDKSLLMNSKEKLSPIDIYNLSKFFGGKNEKEN